MNAEYEAWVVACRRLYDHTDHCSLCPVDGYCDEGQRLNEDEAAARWAVTHPKGVTP